MGFLPWDVRADCFVHELCSAMFGSGFKMRKEHWLGRSTGNHVIERLGDWKWILDEVKVDVLYAYVCVVVFYWSMHGKSMRRCWWWWWWWWNWCWCFPAPFLETKLGSWYNLDISTKGRNHSNATRKVGDHQLTLEEHSAVEGFRRFLPGLGVVSLEVLAASCKLPSFWSSTLRSSPPFTSWCFSFFWTYMGVSLNGGPPFHTP